MKTNGGTVWKRAAGGLCISGKNETVIVHFVKSGGNTLERSDEQLCISGKYEIDRWFHHVHVQWNNETRQYVNKQSMSLLFPQKSWTHDFKLWISYEKWGKYTRTSNSWFITRTYPNYSYSVCDSLHDHIRDLLHTSSSFVTDYTSISNASLQHNRDSEGGKYTRKPKKQL